MNIEIKKICCIGAGYVGGPTMAVIADNCHNIEIKVVDINKERIEKWNSNNLKELPIYEPGLSEIIKRRRGQNLYFTTQVENAIAEADMIFLSVNTPTKTHGIGAGKASDLKWIEASARQVSKYASGDTIVVEKSTLPVKTAETIKKILYDCKTTNNDKKNFYVLSNPEFLAEGSAISDLQNPDRVLIGGEDDFAIEALSRIYLNWVQPENIIKTNLWSSELSKLTANAFLAQRISSINAISAFCEASGADVNEVAKAVGMDSRIGSKFLNAGPGFGGSCFKKDILNLVYLCQFYNLNEVADYWQKVIDLNFWQQKRISNLIVQKLFGTLYNKKIGILGFSFKANTNDTRESPAIQLCRDLIDEGADLLIYDPAVDSKQISSDLKQTSRVDNKVGTGNWQSVSNVYEATKDCDALVIATEWEEFRFLDFEIISHNMRSPSWIFDTRNIINLEKANQFNLNIWSVGKS